VPWSIVRSARERKELPVPSIADRLQTESEDQMIDVVELGRWLAEREERGGSRLEILFTFQEFERRPAPNPAHL
jgi:hypothetical protein